MKLQLSDMLGYLILLYMILSLSSKGRIDALLLQKTGLAGIVPVTAPCSHCIVTCVE